MGDDRPDPNGSPNPGSDGASRTHQLRSRARQIAKEQAASRRSSRHPWLLSYLDEQEEFLQDAYRHFAERSETQLPLSYAGEWVLDNYYVIQQTLRQVRENMPLSYYRELPILDASPLEGYPRVYAVAREIIRYSRSRLDVERLERFVQAYQQFTPLTMGELWALPTMLRLGTLENLVQALSQITGLEQEYESSDLYAYPPLSQGIPDQEIVANGMRSLHLLSTTDWKTFFEAVSRVEQTLRADPAGVYAKMDFDTRDRCRKAVEEIALGAECGEERVAQEAVRLAEGSLPRQDASAREVKDPEGELLPRTVHVGFYLLDGGRAELEAHLEYRLPWNMALSRWLRGHATLAYLGVIGLLSLLGLFGLIRYAWTAGGSWIQLLAVGLLTLVPVTNIVLDVANWLITRVVPPRVLPKLDFEEGVPAESSAMVVIPTLLTSTQEVESLLQQLELHFLSNVDPNLYFALLGDFADAPQKHMPEDQGLLEHAQAGIGRLNQKYARETPGPFFFFHREREWNPGEETWMGWERKRGKLEEFNRLLRGDKETSYVVEVEDVDALPRIRYVITLDADTSLPRESARRLVGTLAHPLNRAQFDADTENVVAGYTVLQPRTEIKPTSANQTLFTLVFSGDVGLDLYSRAVSDVYQDLFGEGIYVGKGIYDVDAFERSLAGRIPENALLSHDLFEGVHGRAGLVTDIVLYEDYPPHYLAYAHRMHRWIRGDWQLVPWLLPRVPRADGSKAPNLLSALDRWKILDNLRRSLLMPALLVLLILGWLWLPGSVFVWTLVGALTTAVSLLTGIVSQVVSRLADRVSLRDLLPATWPKVLRWLLSLAFLPYQSLIALDAIAATLARLIVTHRHLLQWTTAAHTVHLFGRQMKAGVTWMRMAGAPVVALCLAAGLGAATAIGGLAPVRGFAAVPFLVGWILSPALARWISRPIIRKEVSLSEEQRQQLRRLARYTWLYFERFVGPDDHWLPPDHFQEDPLGLVAHRTSPTNIGLLLLSTLAAYDLGYGGLLDLTLRLRDTFEGLSELERYRGHFLNWYNTRTLEPLPPRYISTVDSGNLAGSLLVLRQACMDLQDDPIFQWQHWQGLLDTFEIWAEILEEGIGQDLDSAFAALETSLDHVRRRVLEVMDDPGQWIPLLTDLHDNVWQELNQQLVDLLDLYSQDMAASTLSELRVWTERVRYHLSSMKREVDMLVPWFASLREPPSLVARLEAGSEIAEAWQSLVDALSGIPSLKTVSATCDAGRERLSEFRGLLEERRDAAAGSHPEEIDEALNWCARLRERLESGRMGTTGLLAAYQDLGDQAERLFQDMDFGFLFDPQREVFRIGYNATSGEQDNSYYDLLASEARVTSLLAIAKGDVPQSHWVHMARPLTQVDGMRALFSWSGTMFEYLMPNLFVQSPEGTLLNQSCRAAIRHQLGFARRRGVPWGISESGFYQFDPNQSYQYRAFGVPGLGLKRGLGEDLVIAPYASVLALSLEPQAVMQNIQDLTRLGIMGRYGFYEAVDYTRSRLPIGQRSAIIRSYMVHHQGMILLSLADYLANESMVRRFHADPRVQSVELLLHEQVPTEEPLRRVTKEEGGAARRAEPGVALTPWEVAVDAPHPQVLHLSNGWYGVVITHSGGGYSHCVLDLPGGRQQVDLTRWRPDATLDDWGTWIYIRDQENGDLWSASYQPTGEWPDEQQVLFDPHKAEFRRRDHDIATRMEVTVPPEDNLEIRRLTLLNHSERPRRLTVTSYGEVVLAPQGVDQRHPAFNKLFVESEYLADVHALLFRRRPRSSEEEPIHLGHLLVLDEGQEIAGAYECDRARFIGRGGTPWAPAALSGDGYPLSKATGATLDPIMALGQEIELQPHATTRLAYVTLAAGSRDEAISLIRRYRSWEAIDRAFDRARSQAELALSALDLSGSEVERISQLLSALLYPSRALRPDPATLAANSKGQPGLWAYGISGDYPILLVQLSSQDEIELVGDVLQAHAYWRDQQIKIDLVLVNQRETGYEQELQRQLQQVIERTGGDTWLNQRGGIFIVRADQMSDADRVLLATAARVVLDGSRGSLADQLERLQEREVPLPAFIPTMPGLRDVEPTPLLERPSDLLFDNGLGGFSADGREYVIDLRPEEWTPAPWINVIANEGFGFMVSEAGMGCSWAENSGENRLTPWRNDPVRDTPGEAIYLRDEETAQVWSPTPLPTRVRAPYRIRHGAGYTIFEHHSHGLKQQLRLFAVPEAPVKVMQLRLENTWDRQRRITATYYAEWVLGTAHESTQPYVIPEFDADTQALLARNPYNLEFAERVAFVAASGQPHGLTASRTEFLGRMGNYWLPAALNRVGLAGRVEAGLDPCAAIQLHIELAPGETKTVHFLLGQGANRAETLGLIARYQDPSEVEAAWDRLAAFWDGVLDTIVVHTPDQAMDVVLNRWLLYQALSCRIWGRSALYQSSGAFGFRDQLQDVMALIHAAPDLVRNHILLSAHHQFEAGDVLHWWHPPSGRGVRTRISDDLVWLPYVTAHYVTATGDESILDESVPFLKGDPLKPDEEERYGYYESTDESFTLHEHCRRALEKASAFGRHRLPLMGSGDWNDGMNRVGIKGEGESVWLGWFLYASLDAFASICERVGKEEQAADYRRQARELQEALEGNAWDGNWYRRAYYDDGTALGSSRNRECKIDSIAQSWAVLSRAAGSDRGTRAMESVLDQLVRSEERLILLFTPPFDRTSRDPGYIKGYPPGIRENGGQYTHAALWSVWAFAELGQGDRAAGLFRMLNPVHHSDTREKASQYQVEPYVVVADVYSVPPHVGRGGWTWYTGSSGWMYRLGIEGILGLHQVDGALQIDPRIPQEWPGFEATYRYGSSEYHIEVRNPKGVNQGVQQVALDGDVRLDGRVPLQEDGKRHKVSVLMGPK